MDPDAPPGLSEPGRSAIWEFSAPEEASDFAQQSLENWERGELRYAVSTAVTAFARWVEKNEPTGRLRLALSLHEPSRPLLYVHIADQGILLPDPYRSRDDAKLAVQVLGRPCIAWGASLESEGLVRSLWALFSTQGEELAR